MHAQTRPVASIHTDILVRLPELMGSQHCSLNISSMFHFMMSMKRLHDEDSSQYSL